MQEITNNLMANLGFVKTECVSGKKSFADIFSSSDRSPFLEFLKKLANTSRTNSTSDNVKRANRNEDRNTEMLSSSAESTQDSSWQVSPTQNTQKPEITSPLERETGVNETEDKPASEDATAAEQSTMLSWPLQQAIERTLAVFGQGMTEAERASIKESLLTIVSGLSEGQTLVGQLQALVADGKSNQVALFVELLNNIVKNTQSQVALTNENMDLAQNLTTADNTIEQAGYTQSLAQSQNLEQALEDIFAALSSQNDKTKKSDGIVAVPTAEITAVQPEGNEEISADPAVLTQELKELASKVESSGKEAGQQASGPAAAAVQAKKELDAITTNSGNSAQIQENVEASIAASAKNTLKSINVPVDSAAGQDNAQAPGTNASLPFTNVQSVNSNSMPASASQAAGQVDRASFVNELVQSIRAQTSNNVQEATITLRPEFLGKALLSVRMIDNHVTLRIEVNNMAARDVLEVNMAQLKDSLRERGFTVDQVNIALNSHTKDSYFAQQQNQNSSWQSYSSNHSNMGNADVSEDKIFELANTVSETPAQDTRNLTDDNINYLI